jgi:His-Xaa-Ser system radical SAM maturase HxsB/His-Xaa-Ser system protein HxsD
MNIINGIRYTMDENTAVIYLHQELFNQEALFLFAYDTSEDYLIYLDKENNDNKLFITPKKNQQIDIKSIINQINDHQLRYELNKKTAHLRDVIVEYAFGKKKLLNETYQPILPFTFKRLNDSTVLVVSYAGEFLFLSTEVFAAITTNQLATEESVKYDLIQKNILPETDINLSLNLIATKYRSRKAFLRDFTSLHMIVITKGCNCNCRYCQVSSSPFGSEEIHMTQRTAKRVVDMIFSSPSPRIKIEFQGGEPLLNWKALKYIVDYSYMLNKIHHKQLNFVLCTNLTLIDDSMINYLKEKNIGISTSLDGPKDIHDQNRPLRNGQSSYDLFIDNLNRIRKTIGQETCSPLVTITKESLPRLREIIDEYRTLGFNGIFLRPVNPYGNARNEWDALSCNVEEYLKHYKDAIAYILELNLKGEYFVEYFSMLLLARILTPFSTGFVDLQSPSGIGISGVIYDYNGDVFPSDEARMLARTGDHIFKLGNVYKNSYDEIFYGKKLKELIKTTILEGTPGCSTCVYQAYCGTDPVRNYVESGRITGHHPFSEFCKKNQGIFNYLFELIGSNNQAIMDVFWSWVTHRELQEVRL